MNLSNQDIEKSLTGTLENIKNKILADNDEVIEQNLITDFNKLQLEDQQLFINYVQENYSQYNFIKDKRFKNQQQLQNQNEKNEIVDNQKVLFQQLVEQKQQEFVTLPRLVIEQSIQNGQLLSKSMKQSFLDKFYLDQQDKVKQSIYKINMKCDEYVRRLDQRLLYNYQQAKQNNIQDQEILDYIFDQKGYIEKSADKLIKEKEQELQKEYEPQLRQKLKVFLEQVFYNISIIYNRTKQQNAVLQSADYFKINDNEKKENQDYDSLLFQLICQCIEGKQLTNEQLQNICQEQQEVFKQNYKSINNPIFEKILNDQEKRIPALKLFIEELYKKIEGEIQNSSQEPVNLKQLNTQEHFNKVKLGLVGCQRICTFCKRKCDQQSDQNHKHACSNGHYLIGMNGVLLDNNCPLLDSCEEIDNSCQIQISNQSNFQQWQDVIRKEFDGWNYQQWSVSNLLDQRVINEKDRMINIWNNGVGELLCQYFSQKLNRKVYFQKKNRLRYRSIHYILMLDDSGSMSGSQWENAKNGALQCMQDIAKNGEAKVSVIIFNSDARVVIDCESVNIYKQKDLITFNDGGTSFNNAFLKAYEQLQKHLNKQFEKNVILFYTDGGDSYPADAANKFCQLPYDIKRTIQLFSCAEGNTNQNASLVQLTDNLNKQGISAELKSSVYVQDLQRVWAEVVNQNYNKIMFGNTIK